MMDCRVSDLQSIESADVMDWTGERVIPWQPCGKLVMSHHMIRYAWATSFAYDKTVADLGCGAGYGAYTMSMVAQAVLGVDVSSDALDYAASRFQADNLHWLNEDLETWQPQQRSDLYTCFEVLEHLEDPELLVSRFKPMLWSIPINSSKSKYHVHSYTMGEIDAMMLGASHYQMKTGLIVPRDRVRSLPMYALGLTDKGP